MNPIIYRARGFTVLSNCDPAKQCVSVFRLFDSHLMLQSPDRSLSWQLCLPADFRLLDHEADYSGSDGHFDNTAPVFRERMRTNYKLQLPGFLPSLSIYHQGEDDRRSHFEIENRLSDILFCIWLCKLHVSVNMWLKVKYLDVFLFSMCQILVKTAQNSIALQRTNLFRNLAFQWKFLCLP